MSLLLLFFFVACHTRSSPVAPPPADQSPPLADSAPRTESPPGSEVTDWRACGIDGHQHLTKGNMDSAADNLLATMDATEVQRVLLIPPPQSAEKPAAGRYDADAFDELVAAHPDRLGAIGGGGTLAPTLHGSALSGMAPTAAELDDFEAEARALAADGIAGFGEFAILHLSYRQSHPYVEVPADHPMFLRLADVAADVGLPIDIHLELVSEDMSTPMPYFKSAPMGNNPPALSENQSAFERLLAHNRDATIIWAHVGWDNTGHADVGTLRGLLERNDNLIFALKMLDEPGPVQVIEHRPLDLSGTIRPEWLALLEDYPDRFVLGADEFMPGHHGESPGAPSTSGTWSILDQLPADLAYELACDNPRAIYAL